MRGHAQLWTEGESVPVKWNQTMVFGVVVAGVLWINGQGDGDSGDGKSPGPHRTGRYPVHVQKDEGKSKKEGRASGKKRPEPRSTVSYPIKFRHHDRKKSEREPRSDVSYPIKRHHR
ncbi:hypothetical protein [Streptomyces sp. NPDC048636]|uniref:hypothetical protein n=1 Tax=Streptomyces sp. NPDC048636 TaxID=3155762 RepID=UPI00343F3CA2